MKATAFDGWAMYRAMLEQHLAEAEQHIIKGERHVAYQRERVAKLENGGHNTTDAITYARKSLDLFEDILLSYVAERDRLRKQLAEVRW